MRRSFRLTKDFLYIPVYLGNEEKIVSFSVEGKKIFEFKIPMGEGNCSYRAAIDAANYVGRTIDIEGDFTDCFYDEIKNEIGEDDVFEQHPLVHFSAKYGWINDPNGLVFDGEKYHLYFQHNPFNISWENMSWGHAVSKDLLSWEQRKDVLFPDENGTMFSGCGLRVKNELWFPYTVAGSSSTWSEGKPFYQGLAISKDGGENLEKQNEVFLGVVGKDSRDPKIFWHKETSAYIMILYLEGNDFAIYRSKDLNEWNETQRFSIEEAWECPDLLPVQGTDGAHWMLWSADGFYYWGEFDGYCFESNFKRHIAYIGGQLYATQTYSGIEDRIVAIPWLRLKARNGEIYQGAMGIPREYSYKKVKDDFVLIQKPISEFMHALVEVDKPIEDSAYYVQIQRENAERCHIECNGSLIEINYKEKTIYIDGESINYTSDIDNIELIVDYNILEISISNSLVSAFKIKGNDNTFSLRWEISSNKNGRNENEEKCGSYCIKSVRI